MNGRAWRRGSNCPYVVRGRACYPEGKIPSPTYRQQWVLKDISRHVAARQAHAQAAQRAALTAEQNRTVAQIGQANSEAV